MHFRSLAEQAIADGGITADEILSLRREGWSNGAIDADEADAIFSLNDHLNTSGPEWSDFFVEAISEYIVHSVEPHGYVSEAQGDWLMERIDSNSRTDSITELELLVRVLEKATGAPDNLRSFAFSQIEQAVVTGEGPTRSGGTLEKGKVTDAEVKLLRRIIFASGGDRPAAVSEREAELLFRLKDAALAADNAPEWKQLFVQGVGNYLAGFGGAEPLSLERAAELERFMRNTAGGIGSFLGRMARSNVKSGFADIFGARPQAVDHDAQVASAQAVSGTEQAWLQGQIDANGEVDDYDQALLAFLAEQQKL